MGFSEKIKKLEKDDELKKYFIFTPRIRTITRGKMFKGLISGMLKLTAVFLAIGFIAEWILGWKDFFAMSKMVQPSTFITFIIIMLLFVPFIYIILNILIIKANDIAALPEAKDYIVTPIGVLMFKLTGEILSTVTIFIGVLLFVISISADHTILQIFAFILPSSGISQNGVFYGLFALIVSGILGVLFLFTFYSIAERQGALVDIAVNTKK